MHTASVYGLTACGLTCKGARKLTQETLKQIRLVVGDHVYMTSHSHDEVLDKWSIPHPILDLQTLMDDEPVQDDWTECFTRNRYSPWWMTVRETLIIPDEGKLSQIPPNTPGVPCPTCGVYFLDRSSMLVHMAKHHKDDPHRPRNQHITFDKARDAKDGLHICRHCNKRLCDRSSLCKRCPVLFAIPVREAGDAQPSLGAPVTPSEAHVESDTLQNVPYAQRPHVDSAVRRHGDNAAFHHLTDTCSPTIVPCAINGLLCLVRRSSITGYRILPLMKHSRIPRLSGAQDLIPRCRPVNTVVLSPKLLGSIPLNALYSGSYVLHLRNHGCGHSRVLRGPPTEYGDAVLKEEIGEDITREAKAPKLEKGKGSGRPHNKASWHTQLHRTSQRW